MQELSELRMHSEDKRPSLLLMWLVPHNPSFNCAWPSHASLVQSNNRVTDVGVEALSAALKFNESLQDLSLRGNMVTDTGIGALLATLGFNTELISVDLRDTRCSERAMALLAELIFVKKEP